jgi:choline-glycine betaine transporter
MSTYLRQIAFTSDALEDSTNFFETWNYFAFLIYFSPVGDFIFKICKISPGKFVAFRHKKTQKISKNI